MQEILNWISNNAWMGIFFGGAIGWFFKQRLANLRLKKGDQDLTGGIIERQRTEIGDLREIIKEQKETVAHQRTVITKQNEEKNDMLMRIYKYQDNEIEFTKKIGDLERHVQELAAQVELLSSKFPESK